MENKSFGLIAKAESKLDETGNWASAKVWNCCWCKASDYLCGRFRAYKGDQQPRLPLKRIRHPNLHSLHSSNKNPNAWSEASKTWNAWILDTIFFLVHIISGFLNMNVPSSNLGELNFLSNKLFIES